MGVEVNAIRCKGCGDVIVSRHRHDFKECKCGSVYVDGGDSYQRVGFPAGEKCEDWIEFIMTREELDEVMDIG